jgi:hypothetical protein
MAFRRKRTHGRTQTTQTPITLCRGLGGNEGVGQVKGRIVNQHLHWPKRLLDALEKLRNCGWLSQVSFPGLGLPTLPPDRPDNLIGRPQLRVKVECFPGPAGFDLAFSLLRQCGRLPEIVNKHACALGCERLSGCGADSLRVVPTRDTNHFTFQLGIYHSSSVLRLSSWLPGVATRHERLR